MLTRSQTPVINTKPVGLRIVSMNRSARKTNYRHMHRTTIQSGSKSNARPMSHIRVIRYVAPRRLCDKMVAPQNPKSLLNGPSKVKTEADVDVSSVGSVGANQQLTDSTEKGEVADSNSSVSTTDSVWFDRYPHSRCYKH